MTATATRARTARKPCSACGGEKPPGRRHATCGNCPPRVIAPEEVQQEMVRLYVDEGMSMDAIGERLFYAESTVKRTLKFRGVPSRPPGQRPGVTRRLSDDVLNRTVELYQGGMSIREVAAIFGVAMSTVHDRLRTAGVPRRSVGDGNHVLRLHRAARGEFTDRQAQALAILEQPTSAPITTTSVARAMRVPARTAWKALSDLERLGLAKGGPRATREHGCGAVMGGPRIWSRTDLAVEDVLQQALAPRLGGKPKAEDLLPVGPLRDWLNDWVAREDRRAEFMRVTSEDGKDAVMSVVAQACGVSDRRLSALRFEQRSVSVSLADRILTNAGRGVGLSDLWPDRFPDSEVVAA